MLKQILTAREKERGKQELLALAGENDPRSLALRAAVAGQANGLDGKDVMSLYAPKLEQRSANLGNRVVNQSIDPITGRVVGDTLEEQLGIDPATAAKIAYEKGRDNMEFGFKNAELKQRGNQFGAELEYKRGRDAMDSDIKNKELATRGYQMVQDANGQYVIANPAQGTMKPTGMLGALAKKEPEDPAMKVFPELFKTYLELAKSPLEDDKAAAKMLFNIMQPTIQRMQGGVVQGASGTPATGNGAGAGKQLNSPFTEADRKRLLSNGWTPEQIAAAERRRSRM